jgi:hypothetical protein
VKFINTKFCSNNVKGLYTSMVDPEVSGWDGDSKMNLCDGILWIELVQSMTVINLRVA